MKLLRKLGSTSQILQVFIRDSSSTTGAGLTGLVFNSGSLTAYYHRDTDTTATAITLATMTVGTFTSSGFKEIDATNMPGWYQFCPPNAAFASGAASVGFHLKGAANMAPLPIEVDLDAQVDLTAIDGQLTSGNNATLNLKQLNIVNSTGSAIIASATGSNGHGITSSGNGTGNGILATAGATGHGLRTIGGATSGHGITSTATIGYGLYSSGGGSGGIGIYANSGGTGAGMQIDGGTQAAALLIRGDPTAGGAAANTPGIKIDVSSLGGNGIAITGSSLANGFYDINLVDKSVLGPDILRQGIAQSGSTSSTIKLDSGASATDSLYVSLVVSIVSGTGAGQGGRTISAYVGSTKVATLSPNWTTTPDTTSVFVLTGIAGASGGTAPTVAQIATAVWQDVTAGDFTTAGSIGKSLFTSGNVPGAAGGIVIAGSNAATTFSGLTTGALSCTTITASGAVAFQSTFATTGTTTFSAFTVTNAFTINGVSDVAQTGDNFARIGVAGVGLTNLGDARIVNLDTTVSSRLASASYTAPLTAITTRSAIGLASANLDTQLAALDADILTRASPTNITAGTINLLPTGLDSVLVESGISASAALTNDAAAQLTSINARQALALSISPLAGLLSGAGTTSVAIKPGGNPSGNTRVAATVDASGNRTASNIKVPT